jgi:hypothetical protein
MRAKREFVVPVDIAGQLVEWPAAAGFRLRPGTKNTGANPAVRAGVSSNSAEHD